MKVNVTKITGFSTDLGISGLRFDFILDPDDVSESSGTNAGGGKIQLMSNYCHFYFPFDIKIPHPDLCAFAALKIISPYIGNTLTMDRGISNDFSEAIKKEYPKIKNINVDNDLQPVANLEKSGSAVSFSGGVDSIAAAALLGPETPLIMMARTFHPEIGEFEKWNNPRAQIKTLQYMPFNYKKILVYSDFTYLSTNGKFCIYPDTYAFTTPAILLSEQLGINDLITGDILAAFTGNESIYSPNLESRSKNFFASIGINLDYPCNGVSELITTKIAKSFGFLDISSACEYGDFQKPCMKCIKCFRKSIYKWALFNEKLTDKEIDNFNNSPAIINFANGEERKNLYFMASFKYCFTNIDHVFTGSIEKIRLRAMKYNAPFSWVDKKYPDAYKNRKPIINKIIPILSNYTVDMQEWDIDAFKQLNWKKNCI
ncbi:TPA: hypothetical protein OBP45_001611 [Escherichia coli]|uniref:DUF6395 domain-containing protein n=4 Tax=Escherichia coli TaxID=562 RepID=UPI000D0FCF29|nr:DUF6395 domain-containing protein [Escherichia coli]EAC1961211.1 hypothetical protein [Escherichia coli]EFA5500606.1 hypothetical protein [Escherichia coli]EFB9765092.1 hypothetical protein [Escherichia coli]EFM0440007.1 hypothetical protein [Escherichia coli]EFO4460214.1 hypothetical protein [Escherichia coli]